MTTVEKTQREAPAVAKGGERISREGRQGQYRGREDWSSWPLYEGIDDGLREYWYPVAWSRTIGSKPTAIKLCGINMVLARDKEGKARALNDRCLHRGVPLSMGSCEFAGTVSCPYHGWTYDMATGRLVAVITDGPDSPICGKLQVRTYPVEERLGLVWVYPGDLDPPPVESAIPEELRGSAFVFGGRTEVRPGNWRLAAENGFDEGHAKFLHRTAIWRTFKAMPTWNKVHIDQHGRWLFRIEDERHWEADFPGVGHWSNLRWWKIKPKPDQQFRLGNTGNPRSPDPEMLGLDLPAFSSLTLPGVLRIAYPKFIHYEFYVPVDADHFRYVGFMIRFARDWRILTFWLKYVALIRPLFHGQFSGQDAWMVAATDAPPERLYRPDISLIAWRRMVEREARKGPHEEEILQRAKERAAASASQATPAGSGGAAASVSQASSAASSGAGAGVAASASRSAPAGSRGSDKGASKEGDS
jgi:phenylpropionate dioxygenase-like ring-hydroxylating dioxygenase large terminal subunit